MGMGRWVPSLLLCSAAAIFLAAAQAAPANSSAPFSFKDNFDVNCAEDHFKTAPDGQTWYLSLDNQTGCGFQTRERYRFGWFSMKLKLVGGDSAGVVTAYYMCSDLGAAADRDELDFEFLGNRTGQPYTVQTNIYKSGVGSREMRHMLWFDPTSDFHTYSILWNGHHIVFFVDRVPIRVHKNNGKPNSFFPDEKPMYVFSSIWNADDWATRGGLEKTDWKNAPFVSSYRDFHADGCRWTDPYPACASTTADNWWDQSAAWSLADKQQVDFSWVDRNLVIYDYCNDSERYPEPPEECNLLGNRKLFTGSTGEQKDDEEHRSTIAEDPTLAGALLRMHFQDCFVGGCDASILLNSTKNNVAERDAVFRSDRPHQGESGDYLPGIVSCADIIALAARDAVFSVAS